MLARRDSFKNQPADLLTRETNPNAHACADVVVLHLRHQVVEWSVKVRQWTIDHDARDRACRCRVYPRLGANGSADRINQRQLSQGMLGGCHASFLSDASDVADASR